MNPQAKRHTITLDPQVYRLVRSRADELHVSLSQVVNQLLQRQLDAQAAEDQADYDQAAQRLRHPGRRLTMADVERRFALGD